MPIPFVITFNRAIPLTRRPEDIINVGHVIGLSPLEALNAVSHNPCQVVRHARRRRAYKGVLTVESATAEETERLGEQAASRPLPGEKTLKRTFAELQVPDSA